jgi:hypothetical protein
MAHIVTKGGAIRTPRAPRPHRRFCASIALLIAVSILAVPGRSGAATCSTSAPNVESDFNDDGYADLAVGVPNEGIGGATNAGAVNVIYGSSDGLNAAGTPGHQLWQQGAGPNGTLVGTAQTNDFFGSAVAIGDFNHDGCDDLAVSARGETIGTTFTSAGLVHVIYGSSSGLTATGNAAWEQGQLANGTSGGTEVNDLFGWSLSAGDFDGNGYDDVAIGTPFEDVGSAVNAGMVNAMYGSAGGLTTTGSQAFWQSSGLPGVPENADFVGTAVEAGNFNGDGYDELAVGVPLEDITSGSDQFTNAGAVVLLKGSASKLVDAGLNYFAQGSATTGSGILENTDAFGNALAAGDFNGDGKTDLAVDAPTEDLGPFIDIGSVTIFFGAAGSALLNTSTAQSLSQQVQDVGGVAEEGDTFGSSIAAGDVNGGPDDLIVGVPSESIEGAGAQGILNVLLGSGSGITVVDNGVLGQDFGDDPEDADDPHDDTLGASVATADFNGDGRYDIAAGAPTEDLSGGLTDAGAVNVWHGSTTGFERPGTPSAPFWSQGTPGVDGNAEAGDKFGYTLGQR